MRRLIIHCLLICCLLVAARAQTLPATGSTIDRVAGVLNGEAITASEVEDAARFEQLSAALAHPAAVAPACGPLTAAERQAALEHLIDERLLLESAQRSGYGAAPAAATDASVAHYETLAGGARALATRLAACGLDETALRQQLTTQTTILAYLDARLGATVDPDDADVQRYYDQTFVPEARAQHVAPAPLAMVRARIVDILREQRLATEEDDLLQTLRDDAQIRILQDAPAGGGL